jgi:hypothetical protein
MGNTPDTGVEPFSRKEKWLLSGERRRRSRSLGGGCRRKDSGNRDPRSNPRGGRGHGKRSHRRSGIDGLRDVTEEAALIGMAMRAGRRLLLAGRAAGRYRTPLRRTEAIGVHGKTRHTRREDLRQESQQENWKYQITPSTQRTPLPVYLSVRDEAGAIKRHELKSVPADKLF